VEYSEGEGSFGDLIGLNIRLIIFSGLISPEKGVFRIFGLITSFAPSLWSPLNVSLFSLYATIFWTLISNFVGFGFKARGLRGTWHRLLIFQLSLKDKEDYRLMGPST
jgi:hypothetical protein